MQKNKIIFIVSPVAVGGAERYVENLATGLLKEGYDIKILVSHNKDYASEVAYKFPIVTHYVGDNLWKIFCKQSGLEYIAKNSTIISNGYHSLFVSLLLRIWIPFKKVRHIDIKHGWVNNNRFQKIITSIDKLLSIFCTYVIVVNSGMKSKLNMIASKVVYIRTGIQSLIHEQEIPVTQDVIRLGLVGRIEPEKRFAIGLQVANKVAEKYPTEIHIVGDGSLKDNLINIGCHKNLTRIFYGHTSRDKVPYNHFDILLITSITEGSPLVVLESMFLGKYVIATDVGNLSEILGQERGSVIQEYEIEKIVNKICTSIIYYHELNMDMKKQISNRVKLYTQQNHTLDIMVNNYIKLI